MNGSIESTHVDISSVYFEVTVLLHEHLGALVSANNLEERMLWSCASTLDLTLAETNRVFLFRQQFYYAKATQRAFQHNKIGSRVTAAKEFGTISKIYDLKKTVRRKVLHQNVVFVSIQID